MKFEFKKAFNTLIGKKSYGTSIYDLEHFLNYGSGDDYNKDLSILEALQFYARVSAVNTATNLVADKFKTLEPVIWDMNKQEFIKSGQEKIPENQQDLFNLLLNPNPDFLQIEFLKQIIVYLLVTGNCYLIGTGRKDNKVLEMYIVPSQYVTVKGSKQDSFAESYAISNFNQKEIFKRDEKELRFFSGDRELWHIKLFNPFMSSSNLIGLSSFNPVRMEIKQLEEGANHNLSMLINGAKVGGILSLENSTADQEQSIKSQFNQKHKGSHNAGRVMILNKTHTFTELGKTMRDMDFRNLLNDNEKRIYNNQKIPLPLVSNEASTFNNFEEAQLKLWDNAILPIANLIFQELSNFLLPRFEMETDNFKLTYDKNDIADLSLRRTENFERKQKSGVLTDNELRTELGKEQLTEGADAIYKPANLIPIATDVDKQDALQKPKPVKELTTRVKFIELMKNQIDIKGNRKFTDKEIEELADKNKLV
jgi:HK97 family phage portal protein